MCFQCIQGMEWTEQSLKYGLCFFLYFFQNLLFTLTIKARGLIFLFVFAGLEKLDYMNNVDVFHIHPFTPYMGFSPTYRLFTLIQTYCSLQYFQGKFNSINWNFKKVLVNIWVSSESSIAAHLFSKFNFHYRFFFILLRIIENSIPFAQKPGCGKTCSAYCNLHTPIHSYQL